MRGAKPSPPSQKLGDKGIIRRKNIPFRQRAGSRDYEENFRKSSPQSFKSCALMKGRLIMELMDRDLRSYMDNIERFEEMKVKDFVKQILEGLHHLQSNLEIIHRDLKPANVLIKSEGHSEVLKLGDFGYSRDTNSKRPLSPCLGMASALEMLCGQAYGGKQYHLLGIYLQRSWVVLFLSSLFFLPLFIFASPVLKFIGQPPLLAELTGQVAMWLIPMHLSFAFQFTLTRFLQCQLKTFVVAWISGGVLVFHALLSWIFVYKMRVGIIGIALTLDFSWWISVLGMFVYCTCGWCRRSWTGFSRQAFVGLWDFFKLSLASGVMVVLENFYYRILIIVSGIKSAVVAVDALSICMSFYGWESMIPLGLFAATGIRVAYEIGAGNGISAKFAAKIAVFNSLAIGFIFSLITLAIPDKIAMIFTSNSSVIAMVEELALLLAMTILFNCIQPILSGVAVGSGWQALVAYVNIFSYYFVGVPLAIMLGWLFHFGFKGLWAGMICGTVTQTLILIIVAIRLPWEKVVKDHP